MIYGSVKKAYIIKDFKTGKPKGKFLSILFFPNLHSGFGFVEFTSVDSAKVACSTPTHILNGQSLTCTAFKEEGSQSSSDTKCSPNTNEISPLFTRSSTRKSINPMFHEADFTKMETFNQTCQEPLSFLSQEISPKLNSFPDLNEVEYNQYDSFNNQPYYRNHRNNHFYDQEERNLQFGSKTSPIHSKNNYHYPEINQRTNTQKRNTLIQKFSKTSKPASPKFYTQAPCKPREILSSFSQVNESYQTNQRFQEQYLGEDSVQYNQPFIQQRSQKKQSTPRNNAQIHLLGHLLQHHRRF